MAASRKTVAASGMRPRVDWQIAVALSAGFFLYYLAFTHGKFSGTDEVSLYLTTQALYENGDLAIAPIRNTHPGRDGRRYFECGVGQAVLALPLYAAAKLARRTLPDAWVRALAGPRDVLKVEGEYAAVFGGELEIFLVGLYAPMASALLVGIFYLLERRLGVSATAALISSALLGACTYAATMSTYFLRHTSETLTVLAALYAFTVYRETGNPRVLALGSVVASLTVLIRVPGVIAGPGLALYLACCVRERLRTHGGGLARLFAAVVLPSTALAAMHFWLHYARWGTWIASPQVSTAMDRATPLYVGLWGFLFSPGISVFAYSPLLLLLPWTFPLLWARCRTLGAVILLMVTCYLLVFAGNRWWTGLWSAPGPRYVFPVGVFLMLPLGLWIDRGLTWRRLAALSVLGFAGLCAQLALMTASWGATVGLSNYGQYGPDFSFVFVPQASPILTSARTALAGYIDLWLLDLYLGWPGQPGYPAVARGCALGLLIALVVVVIWLRRLMRSIA